MNLQDEEKLSIEEKNILNAYKAYFFEVDEYQNIKNLLKSISQPVLQFHKIQILQPDSFLFKKLSKFNDIYLDVRKQDYNGLIYLYDVILGYFHLKISLLNFDRNADSEDQQIQTNKIGMGGFGSVRVCQIEGKEFAIKRIYFKSKVEQADNTQSGVFVDFETVRAKFIQIKRVIRQYGIYKICSMLQIGPKVIFEESFDLHCYNDCIEFYMELCEVPCKAHNFFLEKDISYQQFQKDLKTSLLKMHLLKLIHRDIKPDNILYSSERNKFILTDFGLTHTVQNKMWQETLTTYSGTVKYSSPQMMNLYHMKKQGMVNLYMNDIHSLKIVFEQFMEIFLSSCHNAHQYDVSLMSRNSMSFAESYSNHYSYGTDSKYGSLEEEVNSNVDSIINTGSSIPILPTNNTNSLIGPGKYSSEINFYQAEVIYLIANQYLNNPLKKLNIQEISNIVEDKVCSTSQVSTIREEVLFYLNSVFFHQKFMDNSQSDKLTAFKAYLSFCLRGYGPDSANTLQILEKMMKISAKKNQQEANQQILTQKLFQNSPHLKLLDLSLFSTQTTLHKSRSSILRLKYLLTSAHQVKTNFQQKFMFNILIQCLKVIGDPSNVLLIDDLKEIIKNIPNFVSKFSLSEETQNSLRYPKNTQLSHVIEIFDSHKFSSKVASFQRKLNTGWFRQNQKIIQIVTMVLMYLRDFIIIEEQEMFYLIKLTWYILMKRFSGYEFFKPLTTYFSQYGIQIIKKQSDQIYQKYNVPGQFIQDLLKNIYFLAKLNHLCTNDHGLTLVTLQMIDQIKMKVQGQNLEVFYKLFAFYEDFFVELKMNTYFRLHMAQKASKLLIESLKQPNFDSQIKETFQKLSKTNQTTLIQKICILKTYADIKLISSQNLDSLKKIYQNCFQTITQNYSQLNFHKILFEIVNNFCIISIKMGDWKAAMKWVDYWYLFLIENSLDDAERQVIFTCKCFFETLMNFQLLQGDSLDLNGKKQAEIQLIKRYNKMLPDVIDRFIKEKIKSVYKFQFFQHFESKFHENSRRKNNICDIKYPIHRLMTINDEKHDNHTLINKDPNLYNPSLGCRNLNQVVELKKLFLTQCSKNLPYMQWNYRQYSLELGFHFYQSGNYLNSVKFLWNYVQILLLTPSLCTNKDFQYCVFFVELLITTNCSYRRALKFLRNFIFHIPPSQFLTRKKAFNLYNKINSELQISKNQISAKWIKQLCKNGYELLIRRNFEQLIQFEKEPYLRFVNQLCSKWIKKL